jgi:hypothetical protein
MLMINAKNTTGIALTIATLSMMACGIEPRVPPAPQRTGGEPLQRAEQDVEEEEPVEVPQESTRLISDVTHQMTVTLDDSTVLCSSADYSGTFLKVLIPQVADVTLFDHRNTSVNAPCIAAGPCTDDVNPASIVDADDTTEDIALRVVLTSNAVPNVELGTCTVTLTEQLFTTIRGVEFFHQREGVISERSIDDCPSE